MFVKTFRIYVFNTIFFITFHLSFNGLDQKKLEFHIEKDTPRLVRPQEFYSQGLMPDILEAEIILVTNNSTSTSSPLNGVEAYQPLVLPPSPSQRQGKPQNGHASKFPAARTHSSKIQNNLPGAAPNPGGGAGSESDDENSFGGDQKEPEQTLEDVQQYPSQNPQNKRKTKKKRKTLDIVLQQGIKKLRDDPNIDPEKRKKLYDTIIVLMLQQQLTDDEVFTKIVDPMTEMEVEPTKVTEFLDQYMKNVNKIKYLHPFVPKRRLKNRLWASVK